MVILRLLGVYRCGTPPFGCSLKKKSVCLLPAMLTMKYDLGITLFCSILFHLFIIFFVKRKTSVAWPGAELGTAYADMMLSYTNSRAERAMYVMVMQPHVETYGRQWCATVNGRSSLAVDLCLGQRLWLPGSEEAAIKERGSSKSLTLEERDAVRGPPTHAVVMPMPGNYLSIVGGCECGHQLIPTASYASETPRGGRFNILHYRLMMMTGRSIPPAQD